MSVASGPESQKIAEAAHKDKLRKQMHHDLCVLMAGVTHVPTNAVEVYKDLWLLVMKEIP